MVMSLTLAWATEGDCLNQSITYFKSSYYNNVPYELGRNLFSYEKKNLNQGACYVTKKATHRLIQLIKFQDTQSLCFSKGVKKS